jgi:hypothetical protein
MPYVVQAVGVPSGPFWITGPDADGKRILSKRREDAATFPTRSLLLACYDRPKPQGR